MTGTRRRRIRGVGGKRGGRGAKKGDWEQATGFLSTFNYSASFLAQKGRARRVHDEPPSLVCTCGCMCVFPRASIATLNFKPISSGAIHLRPASETRAIFAPTLCGPWRQKGHNTGNGRGAPKGRPAERRTAARARASVCVTFPTRCVLRGFVIKCASRV